MRLRFCFACLITVLAFSSCTRVILMAYGIERHPKPKTEKQIRKAIERYGFSERPNYALTKEGYQMFLHKLKDANKIYMFNSERKSIDLKKTKDCSINNTNLIAHFQDSSYILLNDSFTLSYLKGYMANLDGSPLTMDDTVKQYTAIITWMKAAGRLNKEASAHYYRSISEVNKKYANVNIFFLNLDSRKEWAH